MESKSFSENKQNAAVLDQATKLLEQVDSAVNTNLAQAAKMAKEAVSLLGKPDYEHSPFPDELASAIITLGRMHIYAGNYALAIRDMFEAISFLELHGNMYSYARALNIIAIGNKYLSNHYEAMKYFLKCLEIFKQLGDKSWEAGVLNNIALQYEDLENYDWALKYLKKSLSICESIDDREALADIYETMCRTYLAKGQLQEALENGKKGLEIYKEFNNLPACVEANASYGNVYVALGDFNKANDLFHEGLEIAEKIGHKTGAAETMLRIGVLKADTGELDNASSILHDAIELTKKLDIKRTRYESHKALSDIYKKKSDSKNALYHFEQYFKFYQEVFNANERNRIEALSIMHQLETAQKDAEIFKLKNVALQQEVRERKKIQKELHQLAITDPLTKLFNRRHFFEMAAETFVTAKAKHQEFALIIMDIDKFKIINDSYGHLAGDQVLIELSDNMQNVLRKQDSLGRYGGEEFVVMLPHTNSKEAVMVAERLRKTVEENLTLYNNQKIKTKISVGIAQFCQQCELTIEMLLNRADLTMYAAKQAGGNRVFIWDKDSDEPEPVKII